MAVPAAEVAGTGWPVAWGEDAGGLAGTTDTLAGVVTTGG